MCRKGQGVCCNRSRKGCNPVYKKNGHICRGLCYNDDRWRSRYAARTMEHGLRRIYGTVAGTPPGRNRRWHHSKKRSVECGGSVPDDMSVIVTEISDDLRTPEIERIEQNVKKVYDTINQYCVEHELLTNGDGIVIGLSGRGWIRYACCAGISGTKK